MLTRKVLVLLMSAGLVACGSSSNNSGSSSTTSSIVSSSSSAPPAVIDSSLPIHETFDHVVDSDGFFSTAYRVLESSDTPFYHRLGGTHTFENGQLTLTGGRFAIAATHPEQSTTGDDTETFGELDLSESYRISFCVIAADETGTSTNTRLMVYVNNNTTRGDDSPHGGDSILLREPITNIIPGQRVTINSNLGTETSFIQFRVESGATITLDDLWVGYQSDLSSEPSNISCGGDSNSSSSAPDGSYPILSQVGNPVNGQLSGYRGWLSNASTEEAKLSADKNRADNIITWQMPHGGFDKHNLSVYNSPWVSGTRSSSGWTGAGGIELGTIDNDATITEILFLADVYQRSGDDKYRDAARAAIDFILAMQYPSGGWPQVYPARAGTSYSNHVTFNDDAMIRALLLLDQADKGVAPLDGDLFSEQQRDQIEAAIEKGVGFILNAQIKQDGTRTVWCAQHDPVTYAPRGARAYELPSKSGKESVLIVGFLMSRPQTAEIEEAVRAAVAWYNSDDVKVVDTRYVNRPSGSTSESHNPIQSSTGNTMWYRFYNLEDNRGFFSDRTGGTFYDIMDIQSERRYGYQWGGNYGTNILNYARSVGYLDD